MNKRVAGLVVFLIGVVLIIFGLYAKGRVAGARKDISHITNNPFGHNTATDVAGGVMEGKVSRYDKPVFWSLVGGVVLVVVGGGMMICCCKKKRG